MHDTKNFCTKEFACKCCGANKIDQRVIEMAQKIRDYVGLPVRVNSGYRCEKHNRAVGGVKGSKHVLGKAADLSCSCGNEKLYEAVKELERKGELVELDYCIRYKWGVHIDCGGKRRSKWEVRG